MTDSTSTGCPERQLLLDLLRASTVLRLSQDASLEFTTVELSQWSSLPERETAAALRALAADPSSDVLPGSEVGRWALDRDAVERALTRLDIPTHERPTAELLDGVLGTVPPVRLSWSPPTATFTADALHAAFDNTDHDDGSRVLLSL